MYVCMYVYIYHDANIFGSPALASGYRYMWIVISKDGIQSLATV